MWVRDGRLGVGGAEKLMAGWAGRTKSERPKLIARVIAATNKKGSDRATDDHFLYSILATCCYPAADFAWWRL